jgi:hypothetical protein
MFDTIFNSVFILIPLAIFIGMRILDAQRKRQESQSLKNPNPFIEEEELDEPVSWETDRQAQGGKFPAEANQAPQKISLEADLAQSISQQETPTPERPVSGIFPRKLERLHPLKKALVLSEILGSSKGLRDFP